MSTGVSLPLAIKTEQGMLFGIVDADGKDVAVIDVDSTSYADAVANAEYIVMACNAYADLKATVDAFGAKRDQLETLQLNPHRMLWLRWAWRRRDRSAR